MKTWILILTISQYHANSIEHVPGFSSLAECQRAYKVWITSIGPARKYLHGTGASLSVGGACVESGR